MPDYSQSEFMAVLISRRIRDGWMVWIGTASDIPRAGAILANLHHAPNASIILGLDLYNFHNVKSGEVDFRGLTSSTGESKYKIKTFKIDELFNDIPSVDFFVIGGMEVDKYGNTNLVGIYDSDGNLRVKGPGPIGAASMAAQAGTYAIFMNRHDKRSFVEKLSFRSAFGFGDGFDHRENLGHPGRGPKICITPLGVFDFPSPERAMRLISYHPGRSIDEIKGNTGFELVLDENVGVTETPSEDELRILREIVDPEGVLRG